MTKRRVKTEIPIRQPDKLLGLAEDIYKKNKSEQLFDKELDLQAFHNTTTEAKNKRIKAKEASEKARQTIIEANSLLGIAKGQTKSVKGTVYSTILQIRDELKRVYKGEEEKLTDWGFDVKVLQVRGLRKVKITIPVSNSELLMELADNIYAKYTNQPSILKNFAITEFHKKNQEARHKKLEARHLNETSDKLMKESEFLIGLGYGQTKETPGTIYNMIHVILKQLQDKYKGAEENLNEWGFKTFVVDSKYPIKGTGVTTKKITVITRQKPLITIHIIFKGSNGKKIYVSWGDGTADKINLIGHTTPQSVYHDFNEEGNYEIQINGDIGKLSYFKINGNQLISIDIPRNLKNLSYVNIKNNWIDSTRIINDFFTNLESSNVFNGELDASGGKNAVPNAYGNIAKNNLINRGWDITTN